jgi:cytochrome c-type biogenesis protein CcmH
MTFARAALVAAMLLGAVGSPPRIAAQSSADSAVERRTRELSAKLRCPVCQGESILDSPARLSAEMRDVVREQLRAGRSEDEILDFFEAKYGEWILLEPRLRGANYLVYVVPALAVLAGLGVVTVAVRRWTRPAANVDVEGSSPATGPG